MGYTLKEIEDWVKENPPNKEYDFVKVSVLRNFERRPPRHHAINNNRQIRKLNGIFYLKKHTAVVFKDGIIHNEDGPAKIFTNSKEKYWGNIFAGQYFIDGKFIDTDSLRFALMMARDGGHQIKNRKWKLAFYTKRKKGEEYERM